MKEKVKDKLKENNAIIQKADKGNSIVVIYTDEYTQKVREFISQGNFTTANGDITKTLQKEVRDTVDECKSVIQSRTSGNS